MIKIKVSYIEPEEVKKVLEILKPVVKTYKLSKNKEGQFMKAYIELEL